MGITKTVIHLLVFAEIVEIEPKRSASTEGVGLVARVEAMIVPLTLKARGFLRPGGEGGTLLMLVALPALLPVVVVVVMVIKGQERM